MGKCKATPGPWRIEPGEHLAQWIVGPKGQTLCCDEWRDVLPDEANANARLIAAAPELLEALEGIIRMECDDCSHVPADCTRACSEEKILMAKAAIAKARGEG